MQGDTWGLPGPHKELRGPELSRPLGDLLQRAKSRDTAECNHLTEPRKGPEQLRGRTAERGRPVASRAWEELSSSLNFHPEDSQEQVSRAQGLLSPPAWLSLGRTDPKLSSFMGVLSKEGKRVKLWGFSPKGA